jgi:hypothetical protein
MLNKQNIERTFNGNSHCVSILLLAVLFCGLGRAYGKYKIALNIRGGQLLHLAMPSAISGETIIKSNRYFAISGGGIIKRNKYSAISGEGYRKHFIAFAISKGMCRKNKSPPAIPKGGHRRPADTAYLAKPPFLRTK